MKSNKKGIAFFIASLLLFAITSGVVASALEASSEPVSTSYSAEPISGSTSETENDSPESVPVLMENDESAEPIEPSVKPSTTPTSEADEDTIPTPTNKLEEATSEPDAKAEDDVIAPSVEFTANDIFVVVNTESFNLLKNMLALNENGEELEIFIINKDDFDISTIGVYTMHYKATHPVSGVSVASRTITVVAPFTYSPQPQNKEDAATQAKEWFNNPSVVPMPKWEAAIPESWITKGFRQKEFIDETTEAVYFALVPEIAPFSFVLSNPMDINSKEELQQAILLANEHEDESFTFMLTTDFATDVNSGLSTIDLSIYTDKEIIIDGSNLPSDASGTLIALISKPLFTVRSSVNGHFRFKNLTIANGFAFSFSDANATLSNITFQDVPSSSSIVQVWGSTSTVIIENSFFKDIVGTTVYVANDVNKVTIKNTSINNITGLGISGGNNSTIVLENSVLSNIKRGGGHGAGISTTGNLYVKDSTFQNIVAENAGYSGGAIGFPPMSNPDRVVEIDNTIFANNSSLRYGGAISFYQSEGIVNIRNSYFEGNHTVTADKNSDGGAISVFDASLVRSLKLNIDGCTFSNNIAKDDGGAIFVQGRSGAQTDPAFATTLNVSNSTFYNDGGLGNYGYDSGGTIQVSLRVDATFTNNTFYTTQPKAFTSGMLIGQHTENGNAPRVSLYNNIFLREMGTKRQAANITITNMVANVGNIGNTKVTASILPALSPSSVFGTESPLLSENGSGIMAGSNLAGSYGQIVVPTIALAAHTDSMEQGTYADGVANPAHATTHDQRGVARSGSTPSVGAFELPVASTFIVYHLNIENEASDPTHSYQFSRNQQQTIKSLIEADVSWSAPAGKQFAGWAETATPIDGEVIYAQGSSYLFANTLHLYARWENLYTVTFNSNGGSAVEAISNITHGSTIALPDVPTYSSHSFKGWFKDSQLTIAWEFGFTGMAVIRDTILYAKWQANPVIEPPVVTPPVVTPPVVTPPVVTPPVVTPPVVTPPVVTPPVIEPPVVTPPVIEPPVVTPPVVTPPVVTPPFIFVPEAVAPITTPSAPSISEPAEPDTDGLGDDKAPLVSPPKGKETWAVLNLILSVIMTLGSLFLLAQLLKKEKRNNLVWRILAIISGISALILFFLTQNMANPIGFVDRWTFLTIVILLAQAAFTVVMHKLNRASSET